MKLITKSKTAKLVSVFVGLALAFSFVVTPVTASADTASDLQAQINSLLATIQSLQAQLAVVGGGSTTTTGGFSYTFNTNLTMGSTGADVMNLQKVLNMSSDTQLASTGAGSPGNETSYFGAITKAAVIKFQNKYGITPAAGYVGPITRAKLNSMSSTTTPPPTTGTLPAGCTSTTGYSPVTGQPCSSTGTTLPTGGALMVTAGIQPVNSLAPQGAARVPFTNLTLTAGQSDVTVNSITVERGGLAQDAVFSGIVLLDQNGLQIGIAKTLNSNHQAVIGEPFVIKAGTSKTLTVAGNMASSLSSYAGQVAALNVVAVNTTATQSGSLPIMGAQQTINATLTVGTVTLSSSSYDPNTAGSQPIGTTAYRFSGVRFTAGSAEDVTFKSIRWNQTGSAGSSDLANLVTVVNGTSYPTTVSADGKYFTTIFPGNGIVISKGNSVDAYIEGDVVGSGAAGRTVEFDIYKTTDVYFVGNTYGYGLTPTGSFGTISTAATHGSAAQSSGNPWFQGSTLSITAGSVTTIGKATEVPAQNIAAAVPNQPLGGFATNFSGEPVSVQTMTFTVSTSTASLGDNLLTNITLVDANGAVVAGPVDATWTSSAHSQQTITFTDTVTFPIGRMVYTLKGKVPSSAVNNAVITVATTPSGWSNVTGQTTGNSITISTGAFNMNQMTVKGATLSVNISTSPAAQNVVAGTQKYVFANYQLDASQSGEDIRLSSLPVIIDVTTMATTDLTGCQLWDGATALTTGSRVVNTFTDNTAKTFSFDNSLTVSKGTIKTLSLACDVSSTVSSGSFQAMADTTNGDYSITGVTSGTAVTTSAGLTLGSGNGALMTIGNGSFTAAVDSSSPNYATVSGGTTGVTVGVVKVRPSNEDVNLTKLGLTLTSGAASDVSTVYIYKGTTLVGTATFTGTNTTATSTLSSALTLPRDTDTLLTIKADLAAIGTSQPGVQGKLVKIDPLNAEGYGVSSGTTIQIAATGNVAGVRMFRSFPTVALDTLPSTGVADGKLMRFKITADSKGPVGLFNLNFTMATSSFGTGGGVSAVKVMVYSDSAYSLPVSGSFGASTGQFGTNGTPDASAPTLNFSASTNALQIPAGTTYYFQVEATVTSVSTATSVTTTLNGDAAYIASAHLGSDYVSTTTGALADDNNDFIWSGNATTTAVFNANDWANGYGIPGLPSGGVSQTRSQ